ncbi:MAG TPA: hypothetical protein VF600_12205 [Abditibacteriaceae bacterium]
MKKTALSSQGTTKRKAVQHKAVVVQAVLWLLVGCLVLHGNRLLATAPGAFEGDSDGLIVRISGARWIPISEYSPESNIEGDKRARVLAINYEVEAARDEWLPKTGYALSQAVSILDAQGQVPTGVTSGGSWSGTKGRQWWSGLDPRLKKATFNFEILHPNAPPGATGETEENLDFRTIPLPASPGSPLPINRAVRSTRGTEVVLRSIERVAPGKSPYKAESLALTVSFTPPAQVPDMSSSATIPGGAARDSSGGDLTQARTIGGTFDYQKRALTSVFYLPKAPSPGAKTLDLQMRLREIAPSQKQEKWFHRVKIEFDPSALPWTPEAAPPQPLAQAKGTVTQLTLQSLQSEEPSQWLRAAVRLNHLQAERKHLGATWNFLGWKVRAANGQETEQENPSGSSWRTFFWRPDGSPLQAGEEGRILTLANPAGSVTPRVVSLQVQVQAVRKARHVFDFRKIPFPAKAGEMTVVKQIQRTSAGDQIILWKVGRFDTRHPIPANAPFGASGKPLNWTGLVLVWEFRPAGVDADDPSLTDLQVHFRDLATTDDRGRAVKSARLGDTSFASHDGDVWRQYKELPDGTREGFGATQRRWFSLFRDLPDPGAKSLNVTLQVEASTPLAPPETVTFDNVPVTDPVR